jgi:hypothetical protein
MRKTPLLMAAVLGASLLATGPAFAQATGGACFNKAAQGTNSDEAGAKFQAYEAILQSFDWGAWASWMSNKTTPGYKITTTSTRCKKGGIGFECITQARICKV